MPAPSRLLDLQAIDLAVDRLSARRDTLVSGAEQRAARDEADAAEHRFGEIRLSIDELDRDGGKLEHEIDSLTQKAAAERSRMSDGSVANARELEALGREVENLDRRRTGREDELLVIMERREALDHESAGARKVADELRGRAAEVATSAADELGAVEAELAERQAERGRIAGEIDADALELYDELRASKRGVGAAALVDGVCQGCHETLSAVELDRVKRAEGIPRCEHCRRILVL